MSIHPPRVRLFAGPNGSGKSAIKERVRLRGHPVPPDKIRLRYGKSLSLLLPAMRACDRAYIFDNSGESVRWIAEVEDGELKVKEGLMPSWFARRVAGEIPGFGSAGGVAGLATATSRSWGRWSWRSKAM